jgi:plasmid maintenance system antidote protein VapI
MAQNKKIHIGEIICQKLKAEGRTKKWLAEQVHCHPSNFCRLLQKPTMDTGLLMLISFTLKYNFATHLTDYFNENQIDTGNNCK